MNPERDQEMDVDPNHGTIRTANDVVNNIMKGRKTMADMKVVGQPLLPELIVNLDKMKDKNHMLDICLIAIAEHAGIVNMLGENLKEATQLLRRHGIPFDSMVGGDDES